MNNKNNFALILLYEKDERTSFDRGGKGAFSVSWSDGAIPQTTLTLTLTLTLTPTPRGHSHPTYPNPLPHPDVYRRTRPAPTKHATTLPPFREAGRHGARTDLR